MECADLPAPASEEIQIGHIVDGAFVRSEDGAARTLEFGNQGGQHIWVALRFYAEDGDPWEHRFTVTDADGNEIGERILQERACAPGWTVVENITVFLYEAGDWDDAILEVESGPARDDGALVRSTTQRLRLSIRTPT